jgi:tRNA(Ile2) C34 agmatinyltransferase TiaS
MKNYTTILKISTPPCPFCNETIHNGLLIVDGYLFCKNCGYEIPNSTIETLEGDIVYNKTYEKFDAAKQGYGG